MRRFQTGPAAAWLTDHGRPTSVSKLQKIRSRGKDDPRDRGPDFFRDEKGVCWYDESALEEYVDRRIAALKFRAPGVQPTNFKKSLR